MTAVPQTMFSNAFSWMKMYEFRLKFHLSLFLRFQLTIFQHWFRYWLGAVNLLTHICITRPQWVKWTPLFTLSGKHMINKNSVVNILMPWQKGVKFFRRHFEIHFREWQRLNFYQSFAEVCCYKDTIDIKSALVYVMNTRRAIAWTYDDPIHYVTSWWDYAFGIDKCVSKTLI